MVWPVPNTAHILGTPKICTVAIELAQPTCIPLRTNSTLNAAADFGSAKHQTMLGLLGWSSPELRWMLQPNARLFQRYQRSFCTCLRILITLF